MAASDGRKKSSSYRKNTGGKRGTTAKSSARGKKAEAARLARESAMFHEIGLIVLLIAMVFVFLCNFGLIGTVGDTVSGVLFGVFGLPAYVMPVLLFLAVAFSFANPENPSAVRKLAAGCVLFVMAAIACDLFAGVAAGLEAYSPALLYQSGRVTKAGGGVLGGSISYFLQKYLEIIGTVLVVLLCTVVSFILLTEKSLLDSVNRMRELSHADMDRRRELAEERRVEREESAARRSERIKERRRERENFVGNEIDDEYGAEEGDYTPKRRAGKEQGARKGEARRRKAQEKENERSLQRNGRNPRRSLDEPLFRKGDTLYRRDDMHEITLPEEEFLQKSEEETISADIDKILIHGMGQREEDISQESQEKSGRTAFPAAKGRRDALQEQQEVQSESRAAGDGIERKTEKKPEEELHPHIRIHRAEASRTREAVPVPRSLSNSWTGGGAGQPDIEGEVDAWQGDDQGEAGSWQGDVQGEAGSWQGDVQGEAGSWQGDVQEEADSWQTDTWGEEGTWQSDARGEANSWEGDAQEEAGSWQEDVEEEADSWQGDVQEEADSWQGDVQEEAGSWQTDTWGEEDTWQSDARGEILHDGKPVRNSGTEARKPERAMSASGGSWQESKASHTMREQVPASDQFTSAEEGGEAGNSPRQRPVASLAGQSHPDTIQGGRVQPEAVAPKKYVFPPISLLQKGVEATGESEFELRETAMHLQRTLATFGVKVTITEISQGPSVTRYELQPEQGVKVSKIVGLADDIKLNLAAMDIRIEAPIPGKAAIGIEVPNKETMPVGLRDLLETKEFRDFPSNLAFAVGKDIAGKVVVSDIAKMPHMLIAGATGSGKSVCINTLIMSILYKAKPEDVKMIMVDPKVVELSIYNGIPHLLIPVVTDPKKASAALQWAVSEMDDRYRKFAEYGSRNLKEYNKKVDAKLKKGEGDAIKKLPQIVIIVDELADLMMVCPGEVEASICRLAQLARACGIHLVIATQRPSVDVITGLIKANMPSRVAFSVSSGVDSRTILDMVGAEKLLGKGDMLFYPQGYPKPARVQGAFVSDQEVADVVEFLKNQRLGNTYAQEIEDKIVTMGGSVASGEKSSGGSNVDELFGKAGRLIIDKDKASIGMLQRALQIGFNRAARIMDQLCQYGVVGEEEGTKPRKILMTPEEFEQLLEDVA